MISTVSCGFSCANFQAGAKGILGELRRDIKRVLVIRAGALGDVVLTFPALQELHRRYPAARIDVVGYPALWEAAGDLVDRIESIDHPMFSGLFGGRPDDDLRTWLESVDLAIAWTTRDPSTSLHAAGVPEMVHASPYPPPGAHAARWLVETLSGLPPIPLEGDRGDPPTSISGITLRSPLEGEGGTVPRVLLHPGAGATWKRWPAERFAALAQEVRAWGLTVTLIEGPADEDAVRAVQETAGPLPVLRGLSVRELARELGRGQIFVGNDSGVTHLAAWLGLPTIALFGPSDPASWSPLGDVRVLRACTARASMQGEIRVCADPDCMAGLPVESVLDAVLHAAGIRSD